MTFAKILKFANTIVSAVATVISMSIMAFAGYMIYENTSIQQQAYGTQNLQYKPQEEGDTVSVADLLDNIPDAVGWITMDDTHIDYPVVQGDDDLFYASHDINKDQSLTGAIYLQAKNKGDFSQSYNLLYGHHMDNGAMFGDLTNYLKSDYFNKHLKGKLTTSSKVYDVTVISVIKTDAYEDAVYGITSLDWDGYQNTIVNNSNIQVVNTNPKVKSADKFLVLSTCEGGATNGRVLLICKISEGGQHVDPGDPTPTPTVPPAPTSAGGATPVPTQPDRPTPTPTPRGGGAVTRTGESDPYGSGWALLNLCCLILTVLAVMPYLLNRMDRNDNGKDRKNIRRIIGTVTNIALAIAAVLIFIIFENMRQPMIFNDQYTPLMMIILAIAVATEEIASRRMKKEEKTTVEEGANA